MDRNDSADRPLGPAEAEPIYRNLVRLWVAQRRTVPGSPVPRPRQSRGGGRPAPSDGPRPRTGGPVVFVTGPAAMLRRPAERGDDG